MIITESEIKQRIRDLANEIYSDYKQEKVLYLIYILDGAFIFAADLARELSTWHLDLIIGSIIIKTYIGSTSVMSRVPVLPSFNFSLKDAPVLIVEDILDTGNTLKIITETIYRQKPKNLEFCVLLRKKKERNYEPKIKYVGFEIPDKFVIGYGLDYNNKYREKTSISVYQNKRE